MNVCSEDPSPNDPDPTTLRATIQWEPISGYEPTEGALPEPQTETIVGYADLLRLIDEAKGKLGSGIAVFIGVNEGKAAVAVGVTDDLTDKVSAVDLVRVAAAEVGGKGGGGRADMAQAGGPDGDKAEAALDAVRKTLAG